MHEHPYTDDTIFGDTMNGRTHDQKYSAIGDVQRARSDKPTLGKEAVRNVIPPVLEWGPKKLTNEAETLDGLNFSA